MSLFPTRGPVQRHDVWLPLLGALCLLRTRHQWAAGGGSADREGRLRGPRMDGRWPRCWPQGEPDEPGQALPGWSRAPIIRPRQGPGSRPLQGDEPPQGQQNPSAEVPLLSWPQCTVTHTHTHKCRQIDTLNMNTDIHQIERHGGGWGAKRLRSKRRSSRLTGMGKLERCKERNLAAEEEGQGRRKWEKTMNR